MFLDISTLVSIPSNFCFYSVESAAGSWYRFVVTGTVVGGKLKTPADADSESLQAKWIDDLSELTLRASDVLPLIERGRQYHSAHTG